VKIEMLASDCLQVRTLPSSLEAGSLVNPSRPDSHERQIGLR
jgi:hypothetical protein